MKASTFKLIREGRSVAAFTPTDLTLAQKTKQGRQALRLLRALNESVTGYPNEGPFSTLVVFNQPVRA